ncbi:MAG TPA: class I SAM-dependent methyltransferase [Candidatus Acidoferrum sp.]|jgi:SAM-dependent methyltransferase
MNAANNQPGNFSGVKQIFLYNWHFYAAAVVLDLLVWFWLRHSLPASASILVCFAAALASFWAVSSLLASHYVYDRSDLYQWNWLKSALKRNPQLWINIHAGLDQSSESLVRLFPNSRHRILDIYTQSEMTEPSIRRARNYTPSAVAAERANPLTLPLEDCACDTIFLIFVAHELRSPTTKIQFFHELHRALAPGGCIVLAEHLRDWKNFLAYGPGAFHFFSRRTWLAVAAEAGLSITKEFGIASFVRCFVFTKTVADSVSRQSGDTSCA